MVVDIGTILAQWQSAGVYDYLLPFLLVFAIVFGILTTTNVIGKQKGLHVIIALIIGLMAIGYNYSNGLFFSDFLKQIFPRLAIGLAVLLSVLILIGLFVPEDEKRYWLWGLGAIAFIIAIVVVAKSFDSLGYGYSYGSAQEYIGWIIGAVLIIGLIIAVAASSGDGSKKDQPVIAQLKPWR